MLIKSPLEHIHPRAGELSAGTVIADLDEDTAAEFAGLCDERIVAFKGHPAYDVSREDVHNSMRWAGWYDAPVPVGLIEAESLVELAKTLVLSARTSKMQMLYPTSPLRIEANEAIAKESAWVWSTLAGFEGHAELDGVVLMAMAATWHLDWKALVATAAAATA